MSLSVMISSEMRAAVAASLTCQIGEDTAAGNIQDGCILYCVCLSTTTVLTESRLLPSTALAFFHQLVQSPRVHVGLTSA